MQSFTPFLRLIMCVCICVCLCTAAPVPETGSLRDSSLASQSAVSSSPVTFNHMLLSTYQSVGGLGSFSSLYMGAAHMTILPRFTASLFYGYDLAQYNPYRGAQFGQKLSLSNLKGLGLSYTTRRGGILSLCYGENMNTAQNRLFSPSFFGMSESSSLYNTGSDTYINGSQSSEQLDQLCLEYSKGFFGDKVQIKTVIRTPSTGIR